MNINQLIAAVSFILLVYSCNNSNEGKEKSTSGELSLTVTKHYLNLPVSLKGDFAKMSFETGGKPSTRLCYALIFVKT